MADYCGGGGGDGTGEEEDCGTHVGGLGWRVIVEVGWYFIGIRRERLKMNVTTVL